jgi:hypothetical protein
MTFVKGRSGNPAGRPPKNRALTGILERALAATQALPESERKVAAKQLLARYTVDAALTGRVPFDVPDADGVPAPGTLAPREWLDLVKWLYSHIDGPPKAEIGVEQRGALQILVSYADPAPDDPSDAAAAPSGPAGGAGGDAPV